MPVSAPRPCCAKGCKAYAVADGYCAAHEKPKRDHRRYDNERGTSHERGYDSQWRKARAGYLRSHPLCVTCDRGGLITPATVVDHVVPHKGDKVLFWDKNNWQSLCKTCHDRKTATEDMGAW